MYDLQQQYIEQFLHDAVSACGLIDMRWQTELSAIECGADGVSLGVSSPAGDYRLDADYVLATDGARSPIRSMLGMRLKGENYEGKYVIADIRMDHDFPTERRAFFEPSGNPGGTVLIHKQPDNIWRVDYQLREGESEQEALREENIRARVGAILSDIGHTKPWELEWWSIYSANTLCLDDYRHGRVFFVGDAAHIVPILACAGSTMASRTRITSAGSSASSSMARPAINCSTAIPGTARRDAGRLRQCHEKYPIHDPADTRLAACTRGSALA